MPPVSARRQPIQRVPLSPATLDRVNVLEVVGLRCRLTLHLSLDNRPKPKLLPVVVDSGASYSFIGLDVAEAHRIPTPPPESETEIPLKTASGTISIRVRPGRIRAWLNAASEGYPFDWPVLFRVDGPEGVPPILGLGGVVNTCRWTFDGSYSIESPYGHLTLEDIR